ncbi:hypothetical protein [Mycobacterium sp. CnD-18-1]|uniref:hypothetical protein n=1 Tax=Mycobacterium sp. CnD-18-1 TaxID=2917744 RepID=UPI001EF1CC83|nr:hypothetical protein [Mycobacterium sp. CnD-18-1]MCG7610367.1 hypothetical protein [Mycobacterium sp. CnD-18-1]
MSDPYCIECAEIVPGTECYDDNGTPMHALGVTGVAEPHELGPRIKVQAVRAANGRIQGWAINRGNRELDFCHVGFGVDVGHVTAMNAAQRIARGESR